MRYSYFFSLLALVGCAAPVANMPTIVDGDEASGMSVRKIEVASDIAVIRPDYQIVIGEVSRKAVIDRTVRWDVPVRQIQRVSVSEPISAGSPQPNLKPTTQVAVPKKADRTIYLNDTHFEFGSAKLTREGMQILQKTAIELDKLAPRKLSILGHTDSVGGESVNQKLSERRAEAVFTYLRSIGVTVGEVDGVGFGETAPVADNGTASGRAKNRRAEIMATVTK